ncbi:nuclear exosome regulator NRDE2-like isoform X2 [Paramacrobiotus metropolitanus]|uniref:nuclear exosome regulator NRDE2-like isoform X2 n=1 Tax=Paramacrobiotus metropolitanus TaxID=2943436 RepID=UPI002445F5F6|nr:nuclear exosome regulator NRDE2-like isoform X2 [Paramacrobiotus metropolitanus]
MSLFPAFADQRKPDLAIYTPEIQQHTPDVDVQIVGNVTIPAKSKLPSFSFDATTVTAQLQDVRRAQASSERDVIDVYSSGEEEERRLRKMQRKRKKAEKRERKKERRANQRAPPQPPKTVKTDPAQQQPKIKFLEQSGLSAETAFCVADKPEKINFAFDATYWKDVSKIQRPPRWTLGPTRKNSQFSVPLERYFNAKVELEFMKKFSGVRIPRRTDVVPFGRNYLPFPEEELSVPAEEKIFDQSDPFRARTVQFNERLRENPTDLRLWLEFLNFQEDIIENAFTAGKSKDDGLSTRNGLIQRKIAIIERAIAENPADIDLKIRRLNFCEEVWEKDELAKEWRKLAFTYPNDPFVWKAYYEFQRSYFPLFQVTRTCKLFPKFISISRSMLEGTFQSHSPLPNHEHHLVLFIFLLVSFWMQSGHNEKATGLLQGLLEFNLRFPENLAANTPIKDALVFFEPFWDSGAPRFGSENARGWNNVMKTKDQSIPKNNLDNSVDSDENQLIKDSSSVMELWLKLERYRQNRFLLPFSGDDEPTDPERVVLFDDIESYLFRFPLDLQSSDYQDITFFMVIISLNVLRCPLPRCFSTRSCAWRTMLADMLENPWTTLFGNWSEAHANGALPDSFALPLLQPLANGWADSETLIVGIFEQSSQVLQGFQSSFLVACYLQFKLSKFISSPGSSKSAVAKDIRTTAKTLLKQPKNRNDLIIWEWYAFAEGVLEDSPLASSKILELILTSTIPDKSPSQTLLLARLVRFYVMNSLGLLNGSKLQDASLRTVALSVLVQFIENRQITFNITEELHGNRVLKARKAFEHLAAGCPPLSADPTGGLHALGSMRCNVAICWALFEYLSSGHENAVKTLSEFLTGCRNHPGSAFDVGYEKNLMDWEILTEFMVMLNQFHQKNGQLPSESFLSRTS